jgi:hypothetical protein
MALQLIGRGRVETRAAPPALWDRLSNPRGWPEWNAAVAWAVAEKELAPGAFVTIKPLRSARQTAFTVIEADPPRRLALRLTFGPLATLVQTWTIVAAPDGASIEQTVEIDGPLAGLLVKRRAQRLADEIEANLGRIAQLAVGLGR